MQYSAWQLSAEHRTPQLCPVTSGHTCGGLAWHNLTLPCPLGIWSRLVPMPPLLLNQRENKIIKNQTPLKYPHPLHAILGQMNKQKLLFLTFMQNDRGGWGKIEHGSDIVTGGGAPTRNTRTCPDHGSATADHNVSSLEPCPICSWSLAGILSSLGVGSNTVPGVRVLGVRPTPHSSGGRAHCLSLSGTKQENSGNGLWLLPAHTQVVPLGLPRGGYISTRDQLTQGGYSFARFGAWGITPATTLGEWTPASQSQQEEGPRGK